MSPEQSKTVVSGSLFEAATAALEPASEGGSRVTASEALRARQSRPWDKELTETIFGALQTVEEGIVFSEAEVQGIERLTGGGEFLKSLDNPAFHFDSFRLFAPQSPYSTELDSQEKALKEIEENTGVQVVVSWYSLSTARWWNAKKFFSQLLEGRFNDKLKWAHENWHISRLSVGGCSDLVFLLDADSNKRKLPSAEKVRALVNADEADASHQDAVTAQLLSGRMSVKKFKKEEAKQSQIRSREKSIGDRMPHHTVEAIPADTLDFLQAHATEVDAIFGAVPFIQGNDLEGFVQTAEGRPDYFDFLHALAQAGLLLRIDGDPARSTLLNRYAISKKSWELPVPAPVLERTRALANKLPEGRLVITERESLLSYLELIQTDEGFAFLDELVLPELNPQAQEERLNSFLLLVHHRGLNKAKGLALLRPPLSLVTHEDGIYRHRIEDLLYLPFEDLLEIGALLSTHYPAVLGNHAFYVGDYVQMFEYRDVLADNDFESYFTAFVKAFRFSAEKARETLLDDYKAGWKGNEESFRSFLRSSYPKSEEDKKRAALALQLVSDLYRPADKLAYAKGLFIKLQESSEEELSYFQEFKNLGLIQSIKEGFDFTMGIPQLLDDPYSDLKPYTRHLLEKGILQQRWLEVKEMPLRERDSPYDILCTLAAWPAEKEFSDIHTISGSLARLTGNSNIFLAEAVYFGLTPKNKAVLNDRHFADWLGRLSLLYPNLYIDSDRESLYSPLTVLAHIYQSNTGLRERMEKPSFAHDWARLDSLLNGLKHKEGKNVSDPFTALLLDQYPQTAGWPKTEKFIRNWPDRPDEMPDNPEAAKRAQRVAEEVFGSTKTEVRYDNDPRQLYKILWLIHTSKKAREIWEAILDDPDYGRDIVYAAPPVRRTDDEGKAYEERPDWSELNPVIKFLAVILKLGLDDRDLSELVAQDMEIDIPDKTTEHGGALFVASEGDKKSSRHRLKEGPLDFALAPVSVPSISVFDGAFSTMDPCTRLGLIHFHFHALAYDDRKYAGPSLPDFNGMKAGGLNDVVFTSTGRQGDGTKKALGFNADIYGYDHTKVKGWSTIPVGVVVDLGERRVRQDSGEMIVVPEPYGHDEDYVREYNPEGE